MAHSTTTPASVNYQAMDLAEGLQNLTLANLRSFRGIETTISQPQLVQRSTDTDPAKHSRLGAEIADIETQVQTATTRTLELKTGIHTAYNLDSTSEVWEQIAGDEQGEFGHLGQAVRDNEFFVELLGPMVNSLRGLLDLGNVRAVEGKMRLIRAYLPGVEENVAVVSERLQEKLLVRGLQDMQL